MRPTVLLKARAKATRESAAALLKLLGPRAVQFYGGVLVAAAGGCMLSTPWTLVIVGGALALHAAVVTPIIGRLAPPARAEEE